MSGLSRNKFSLRPFRRSSSHPELGRSFNRRLCPLGTSKWKLKNLPLEARRTLEEKRPSDEYRKTSRRQKSLSREHWLLLLRRRQQRRRGCHCAYYRLPRLSPDDPSQKYAWSQCPLRGRDRQLTLRDFLDSATPTS